MERSVIRAGMIVKFMKMIDTSYAPGTKEEQKRYLGKVGTIQPDSRHPFNPKDGREVLLQVKFEDGNVVELLPEEVKEVKEKVSCDAIRRVK